MAAAQRAVAAARAVGQKIMTAPKAPAAGGVIQHIDHTKMPNSPEVGWEALDPAYNPLPPENKVWRPVPPSQWNWLYFNHIEDPDKGQKTHKGRLSNLALAFAIVYLWWHGKTKGEMIGIDHKPPEVATFFN